MSRRPTLLALTALAASVAACRDAAPWSAPGWCPPNPPQRIVAGSVFAAEVLIELVPRGRIAAVHELAAMPEYSLVAAAVADLPRVGPEPEQLLQARPDLVVIDAFTRAETQALLDAAGVPIVRMAAASSFDDIATNIRRLGELVYANTAAERLVATMHARRGELAARGERLARWRLCGLDGALHSYGRGSLFDAVVTTAGAHNLMAENGGDAFRRLDVEEVLGWRPDAIVLSGTSGGAAQDKDWLLQHPGLRLLPCVARDRLLFVPPALLATTSHHLVDAVDFVQQALLAWGHP
ncbi:MAG: ABC transporter substrate-binding protein [Planctomycetes bacterium]|nr:ABC transporter substrate-binding protein [Planctomycetota bacterium]